MDEEFWRDLGRRIAAVRRRKGLTQAQLSTRAGISHNFLARMEIGDRHTTFGTLWKIADALDVPLPSLLMDEPAHDAALTRFAHAIRGLPPEVVETMLAHVEALRRAFASTRGRRRER
jgi:transcriptional regulator with XRE-family HTH domain